MSRSRRVVSALSFGYLSTLTSALIGIALTPFLLSKLGIVAYGAWAVVAETLSYAVLLDFGVTGALSTFVAVASGREPGSKERSELGGLASTGLSLQSGAAVLLLFMGLSGSYWFLNSRTQTFPLPNDAFAAIGTLLLARAIDLGGAKALHAILVGRQILGPLSFFAFISSLTRSVIIFIALLAGMKLLALGLAELASTLVMTSGIFFLYLRHARDIPISLRLASRRHVPKLMRLGGWLTVGAASALLLQRADNIVTGSILGPAAVTVLAVTRRAAEIFTSLLTQAINWIRPGLGQMVGAGDRSQLLKTFLTLCGLVGVLGTSLAVCTMLINPYFVKAWVGPKLYGGNPLNLVLGALLFLNTITLPARALLTAGMHVRNQSLMHLAEACCNLLLSIYLTFQIGLLGVMLGTLIPRLLFSAIGLVLLVRKAYGFRISSIFCAMYKPVVLIGIPSSLALWVFLRWIKPAHLWQLLAPGLVGLSLCALTSWLFFRPLWQDIYQRFGKAKMVPTAI